MPGWQRGNSNSGLVLFVFFLIEGILGKCACFLALLLRSLGLQQSCEV